MEEFKMVRRSHLFELH